MSEVLVIQNTRIEGAGILASLLKSDGFIIRSIHAKHENLPSYHDLSKYSVVVVLGAPNSANDNLPYLRQEEELIRSSIARDIPTLGYLPWFPANGKGIGSKSLPRKQG